MKEFFVHYQIVFFVVAILYFRKVKPFDIRHLIFFTSLLLITTLIVIFVALFRSSDKFPLLFAKVFKNKKEQQLLMERSERVEF